MSIQEKIKPFTLCYGDNSTSIILGFGEYKTNIFEERSKEGFNGSGYDWSSLASVFLEEKVPHLIHTINFDSEADMFCAYSKNKAALLEFAIAFRQMCEDENLMRDLFSRAILD